MARDKAFRQFKVKYTALTRLTGRAVKGVHIVDASNAAHAEQLTRTTLAPDHIFIQVYRKQPVRGVHLMR